MDIKQYNQEVIGMLNSLTDEQFMEMLNESGLEGCPLENTTLTLSITIPKSEAGVYSTGFYSSSNLSNTFLVDLKVA